MKLFQTKDATNDVRNQLCKLVYILRIIAICSWHSVESVQIRTLGHNTDTIFSGPYFPVLVLEKTPYLDIVYTMWYVGNWNYFVNGN